ncbi:MAG: hypothetical protein NW204_02950 [Xanthomonadaceae bacterium]|nr:hypothetical protein [Xanthomonadaceae bacterium]
MEAENKFLTVFIDAIDRLTVDVAKRNHSEKRIKLQLNERQIRQFSYRSGDRGFSGAGGAVKEDTMARCSYDGGIYRSGRVVVRNLMQVDTKVGVDFVCRRRCQEKILRQAAEYDVALSNSNAESCTAARRLPCHVAPA